MEQRTVSHFLLTCSDTFAKSYNQTTLEGCSRVSSWKNVGLFKYINFKPKGLLWVIVWVETMGNFESSQFRRSKNYRQPESSLRRLPLLLKTSSANYGMFEISIPLESSFLFLNISVSFFNNHVSTRNKQITVSKKPGSLWYPCGLKIMMRKFQNGCLTIFLQL